MAAAAVGTRRGARAPGRIAGIDIARGCAVLGMLAAHLLVTPDSATLDPATWLGVVNGNSSILFAVLAGVSLGLISGGTRPVQDRALSTLRGRVAVRAGLVWLIGILLIMTGVPVYVILPAYAVLFLLALPLLSWSARPLWVLAAVWGLVMPWVQPLLNDAFAAATGGNLEISAALGWHYPFTLWIAFVIAGMAYARTDLTRVRVALATAVTGVLLVALASVVDALTAAAVTPGSYLDRVWTTEPHSGGFLEVWSSAGAAFVVIGVALLISRTPLAVVLYPLRAVGSMPLTAYTGQIVAWAVVAGIVLGDPGDLAGFRDLGAFGWVTVGIVVFCTIWSLAVGQGPLERLLAGITRWTVSGEPRSNADRLNG